MLRLLGLQASSASHLPVWGFFEEQKRVSPSEWNRLKYTMFFFPLPREPVKRIAIFCGQSSHCFLWVIKALGKTQRKVDTDTLRL